MCVGLGLGKGREGKGKGKGEGFRCERRMFDVVGKCDSDRLVIAIIIDSLGIRLPSSISISIRGQKSEHLILDQNCVIYQ